MEKYIVYDGSKILAKALNYFDLIKIEELLRNQYEYSFKILKKNPSKYYKLDDIHNNIKLVNYWINKCTSYKSIRVNKNQDKMMISFPPNTKKEFIKRWLLYNGVTYSYENISIYNKAICN